MRLLEIRRYPVKSMLGEIVDAVDVDRRGLVGDRLWAVQDPDGKLGSGKSTRRFRRMPGLVELRSVLTDAGPLVELPDGRTLSVHDPAAAAAVGAALDRTVTIARETEIMHHDEGPISVITTAGQRLAKQHGAPVDPSRFRANLLIDTGSAAGYPEDHWVGRPLHVGPEVVLLPVRQLTRCVMIDMPQDDLPGEQALLHTVATHHDMTFGVWATVTGGGRVRKHDTVVIADQV